MPKPHRPLSLLSVLGLAAVLCGTAPGQERSPLRVGGLSPGGLRIAVTERWGEISFTVRNPSNAPREARVVAFHDGEDDAKYARDLHVPANVSLTAWMSIGPVPKLKPGDKPFSKIGRTLHFILFDRTGGTPVVVLPDGDEKLRDRAVLYRPKTEWSTALLTDEPVNPDESSFRHPTPDVEAAELVRVMRNLRGASDYLSVVRDPSLPATPEAYDGTDQIVLACNRLKSDPHSRAALRAWVERGGQLWVMLDQVEADLLGSLLGEECAPQVVDRTSLTSVRFQRTSTADRQEPIGDKFGARDFERPVAFVRVALTGRETVHHYVDSWPASFSVRVGRGRILVTTLGPHAWYRPRVAAGGPVRNVAEGRVAAPGNDLPSPFPMYPDMPVALDPLVELSTDLKPAEHPFTTDDLRPLLLDEIGYQVPDRRAVAGILGAFVAALVGIGFLLRRSRRTEIVGWLVPGAAVAAGAVFYFFAGASRHSIPPTAAIAELAEAIPGSGEIARIGAFAAYQPTAGPVRLAAPRGGVLDFDFDGLDGQTRMRVQTDRDAWHYEQLSVPAGVRQGLYRTTDTDAASAIASFGPDGVRGQLVAAGYRDPADAILVARNRETSGVRIAADGTFTIGRDELLAPDQYLAGAVLSDRQQRRQSIFRKLVGSGLPDHYDNRDFLMAWTSPAEIPFRTNEGSRAIGSSLLAVPVEYERPAAGTSVFVPRAFLPYRRWLEGRARAPTLDSTRPIEMRLRFQLPASVVPMAVEKATLIAKVRAPQRKVVISGYEGETAAKIFEAAEPTELMRVEITDPRFLKLDATGGLHVGFAVTGNAEIGGILESFWAIESLQMELTGKTVEKK